MNFVKMLNDIKENPELLETFDDQCLIWWNKKDLIELIKKEKPKIKGLAKLNKAQLENILK